MGILLNDLLGFSPEELRSGSIKVRFNQHNGIEDPLEVYKRDPDLVNTRWLLWRTKKRLFKVGDIAISLLRIKDDLWLLTTIKKIEKDLGRQDGVNYEATILPECERWTTGRVFVSFHKDFQTPCRDFSLVCGKMSVSRIDATAYAGDEFPGYDKVCLSYEQLSSVVKLHRPDWVNALRGQKAVYVMTDCSNGKLYVGSASSDRGMLLDRWTSYVKTFHGGDVELKELTPEHIKKHFQYTIIENYNSRVDDHIILARESFWKRALDSRSHGYNRN